MEFLRQGVLMTYYSKRFEGDHLLKYVYPITVKENGPGYVIGEGKIVTRNSGVYHFHRNLPLKARIFGGTQAALRREVTSTLEEGLASVKLESLHGELQTSAYLADWSLSLCVTRPYRVCLRCGSQVRSTELQRRNYFRRCPLHYMLDIQLAG